MKNQISQALCVILERRDKPSHHGIEAENLEILSIIIRVQSYK